MMNREVLTQDELKKALHYNPDTGLFIWAATTSSRRVKGKKAGSTIDKGYIGIQLYGYSYQAHRLAWLYIHGEFPPDQIDHINHDKSDNRLINLRCVSNSENQKNMPIRKDNISGAVGVFKNKVTGKWCAHIKSNGKRIHLGTFDLFIEAIFARREAESIYGFHKNHGIAADE